MSSREVSVPSSLPNLFCSSKWQLHPPRNPISTVTNARVPSPTHQIHPGGKLETLRKAVYQGGGPTPAWGLHFVGKLGISLSFPRIKGETLTRRWQVKKCCGSKSGRAAWEFLEGNLRLLSWCIPCHKATKKSQKKNIPTPRTLDVFFLRCPVPVQKFSYIGWPRSAGSPFLCQVLYPSNSSI